MADKPLFTLDTEGRFQLAADSHQWVIRRQLASGKWRPLAVGLRTRADVFACLRHKDILITPEALRRIDTELMAHFDDWKAARAGRRRLDPAYHAPGKRPGRAGRARVEVRAPPPAPASAVHQRRPGVRVSDLPPFAVRIPVRAGPLPDRIDMPDLPSWLRRAQPAKARAA